MTQNVAEDLAGLDMKAIVGDNFILVVAPGVQGRKVRESSGVRCTGFGVAPVVTCCLLATAER